MREWREDDFGAFKSRTAERGRLEAERDAIVAEARALASETAMLAAEQHRVADGLHQLADEIEADDSDSLDDVRERQHLLRRTKQLRKWGARIDARKTEIEARGLDVETRIAALNAGFDPPRPN
jgi:hypothetical protein